MASIANYLHFISKCIAEFHLSKEYVSNMCFFYVWMQLRYFPEVTGTLCLLLCTDIWVSTSFCIIVSWEKFLSAVYGFLDTLKRFKTSSSQETFATHKTDMAKYKTFCFFSYLLFHIRNHLQESSTSFGDPGSWFTWADMMKSYK